MKNIKSILMSRDSFSPREASSLIKEAKVDLQERLLQGEMPYDTCEEWFGLEPDYILELM